MTPHRQAFDAETERESRPHRRVDPKNGAAAKPAGAPEGAKVEAPLPRVDFGSDDDFQLQQAMNHLKGAPVVAKAKSISAQAKPQ